MSDQNATTDSRGTSALGPSIICEVIRAHTGYGIHRLRGPDRRKTMVLARHCGMYLCRRIDGLSYPAIGKYFERDHTTVLAAERRVQAIIDSSQGQRLWNRRLAYHGLLLICCQDLGQDFSRVIEAREDG